jgi:hypothetical protein
MLATLKSYGGKRNLFVQPSIGFKKESDETELSRVRITVVPTAQTLFFATLALLTISATS